MTDELTQQEIEATQRMTDLRLVIADFEKRSKPWTNMSSFVAYVEDWHELESLMARRVLSLEALVEDAAVAGRMHLESGRWVADD